MPSARDITAMAVTNGVLKSVRKASFRLVMEFPRGCRRIGSCTRERDPASLRLTGLGTYDLRHRFVPRGLVELHMASLRGPRQARPPMPEVGSPPAAPLEGIVRQPRTAGPPARFAAPPCSPNVRALTRGASAMGVIPPRIRRIIDFVMVALFAAAPFLTDLHGRTRMASFVLAALILVLALMTAAPGEA